MRRYFSAILLLLVFFTLQFGKVAGYLYCKWKAEIIQNKPDCGCDDQLVAMFDHHDDDSKTGFTKTGLNEIINEFMPRRIIEIKVNDNEFKNCFTAYSSSLAERPQDDTFHPPIL